MYDIELYLTKTELLTYSVRNEILIQQIKVLKEINTEVQEDEMFQFHRQEYQVIKSEVREIEENNSSL